MSLLREAGFTREDLVGFLSGKQAGSGHRFSGLQDHSLPTSQSLHQLGAPQIVQMHNPLQLPCPIHHHQRSNLLLLH